MKEAALTEITLRKYERPSALTARQLVKKICLSLGLLQPGDSRDVIVDILLVLLEARKHKQELELGAIKERVVKTRQAASLELRGMADSNIRRQLKRLCDLFIVERHSNVYRITEFEALGQLFEQKIEKFYIVSIVERIKEYLKQLDSLI